MSTPALYNQIVLAITALYSAATLHIYIHTYTMLYILLSNVNTRYTLYSIPLSYTLYPCAIPYTPELYPIPLCYTLYPCAIPYTPVIYPIPLTQQRSSQCSCAIVCRSIIYNNTRMKKAGWRPIYKPHSYALQRAQLENRLHSQSLFKGSLIVLRHADI